METAIRRKALGAASSEGRACLVLRKENQRLRTLLRNTEMAAARTAALMREGDHRIKNSLQIVASVIRLQARQDEDAAVRRSLTSAVARIQMVARLHDALQTTSGEDKIDLGPLLVDMCSALHSMAGDAARIAVVGTADSAVVSGTLARSILLAVNELIMNALRHAFSEEQAGMIDVSLSLRGSEIRIVVADNGRGLPSGYADGAGYGMQLVRMMAEQTGGHLYVDCALGARFTLVAPLA